MLLPSVILQSQEQSHQPLEGEEGTKKILCLIQPINSASNTVACVQIDV